MSFTLGVLGYCKKAKAWGSVSNAGRAQVLPYARSSAKR